MMLRLIDDVITQPPPWNDPYGSPGLALNNILAPVVVTPAGFSAFCDNALNSKIAAVLHQWFELLESPKSADVLITTQWLSPESIFQLSSGLKGFDPTKPTIEPFLKAYVQDSDRRDPHWGFKTWNGFFSRPFLNPDYERPLDTDKDALVSAADSRVYCIASNVREMDTFWLKGHKYSLKHLLASHYVSDFIGGTVFQSYLLPSDYHRWTMPFAGTIEEVVKVDGTYFALSQYLVDPTQPDEFTSLVEGLPYLATVSTRWLVFIKPDDPRLGDKVCFIPVGLQEISSVKFGFEPNELPKKIDKGELLGMFKFGGSTTCLIFQPKVNITWGVTQLQHIQIRSKIGTIH